MTHRAVAALAEILEGHAGLGKGRLETLCLPIVGMVGARTVSLGHVACERPGRARIASRLTPIAAVLPSHVRLGQDRALPLIAKLLGLEGTWYPALGRTQRKIGAREVNRLVPAAVTRRFRVPLIWTLLGGRGNSAAATRIALMRRRLAHLPASTIRLPLADREFIGVGRIKTTPIFPSPSACARTFAPPAAGRRRAHALRPPAARPADEVFPRPAGRPGRRGDPRRPAAHLRRQAPRGRAADRRLQRRAPHRARRPP